MWTDVVLNTKLRRRPVGNSNAFFRPLVGFLCRHSCWPPYALVRRDSLLLICFRLIIDFCPIPARHCVFGPSHSHALVEYSRRVSGESDFRKFQKKKKGLDERESGTTTHPFRTVVKARTKVTNACSRAICCAIALFDAQNICSRVYAPLHSLYRNIVVTVLFM